jgi:hypothetical protein
MNTALPDNANTAEHASSEDMDFIEPNLLDDDLPSRPAKARRYNREARRKIEEYLENKKLALLTRDLLFEE